MENNDYTVAERADSTVQAHLTADKWNDRHMPQRTVDGQGRNATARPTTDVNNTRAHSEPIKMSTDQCIQQTKTAKN